MSETPTRPLYWSIRRELWENRSLTIAPLAVAGLVLFATAVSLARLPGKMRSLPSLDAAQQHATILRPFAMAPAPIMFCAILVGLFYALDALHGERRDRSILFWKSLPVSDATTVLSKALVPLALLPLYAFALSAATFYSLLVLATMVVASSGASVGALFAEVPVVQLPVIMLYGLVVHAFWLAPVHGWLFLVSAWARRAPAAWAVLPFVAAAGVERAASGTTFVASFLKERAMGAMAVAFDGDPACKDTLRELTPLRFLSTPGLWIGLLFAAICFVAAVRLRRYREPI